jgi:hydrogenase nickel incorporation protein HypA/HybF
MHELSLAQNIIEIVQDIIKDRNGAEVTEVGVDIGELVAVIPESLEFCYDTLVEETPLKGSRLKINIIPLIGICKSCQKEFHIEHMAFTCPHCKSPSITVNQGQELKISYLEVD